MALLDKINYLTLPNKISVQTSSQSAAGVQNWKDGSSSGSVRTSGSSVQDTEYKIGQYAVTEGSNTKAQGQAAHAEGTQSTANGASSHAEGVQAKALGNYSHAEGYYTQANGISSHVEGMGTKSTHAYQHVFGTYNKLDSSSNSSNQKGTYVEIVGNGGSSNSLSNARTLDWEGNETLSGGLTVGADNFDSIFINPNGIILQQGYLNISSDCQVYASYSTSSNLLGTLPAGYHKYYEKKSSEGKIWYNIILYGMSIEPGWIVNSSNITEYLNNENIDGTRVQMWNDATSWVNNNKINALEDQKVKQNDSNNTAANDFRVLLSTTTSDYSEIGTVNKSTGLRFMPSTNHLYVGNSGNDALITVSPRMHLGAFKSYDQDGSTFSEKSYGVGIGIDNGLAYTSYFTTTNLLFQHWNATRPSGGTPSSTNYVASAGSITHAHVLLRDYSGKESLTTESELTSARLSFTNSAGTTYTVTPTKINKWDNYTDTKNTAGSTNTSSKIFLVGATSQAANPVTYSHDTAYVGTDGHLYSNSRQVVNVSNTQTLTNKTLTSPTINEPAVSNITTVTPVSFWTENSANTESVTAFAAYRWGNLISVRMNIKTKSTVSTDTTATLGTVGANYKSATLVYANVRSHTAPYAPYTGGSVWISGDSISCRLPGGVTVNLSLVYLINPDA